MTASWPGCVTPSVSRLKSSGNSDVVAAASAEPRTSRLKASPIPVLMLPPHLLVDRLDTLQHIRRIGMRATLGRRDEAHETESAGMTLLRNPSMKLKPWLIAIL